MSDIFNNTIICGKCNLKMDSIKISRNGFILRAVKCPKCNTKIVHPKDEQDYINFINLKKKIFDVKLRIVGNSYAVSIPKEIINFIKEQEKTMDDVVKLCLEDFGRITLIFGNIENNGNNQIRIIKEEIKN